MSLSFQIKVYCSNCKKGLHNIYTHNDDFTEFNLKTRRCKEEFERKKGEVVKCQCLCLTHYQYNGKPVPIGQKPPETLMVMQKELGYDESIEKLNEEFRELSKKKETTMEGKNENPQGA